MNPTRTEIDQGDSLISPDELAAQLGLYDDQSQQQYTERLSVASESAVRAHLNRPLPADRLKAWFETWPTGRDAFIVPDVVFGDSTTVTGAYYDSENRLQAIPGRDLFIDPTTHGRLVCRCSEALSTSFGAPVVVTLSALGDAMRTDRVKQAILDVARILYQARGEQPTQETIRSVCAQLIGGSTVLAV